ncbi:MAG TPA: HIT domain-containing protein [Kineosporiaceae bacterium]|nr:HIT domain-containing protein [Kineosporiaceae bacterium]
MAELIADWRQDRLGSLRAGTNPTVLARMATGWAVIGDYQHLPGYCVLLHDGDADQLTDLPRPQRAAFLQDMSLLGEAVAQVCARLDQQFLRVNYEILGNSYPHLHAHIHPRYAWEPEDLRRGPVWLHPDRTSSRYALGPGHDQLRALLTTTLHGLLAQAAADRT